MVPRAVTAVAAFLALLGPRALPAQATGYLSHDALTRELRAITGGSGNRATLRSLARSPGGRDVWLVTVGNPAGPSLDTRPALLVVGNLSGDHLLGSALALETIRFLLAGGDSAARADSVLAQRVVYVIPRLNPDGAEAMGSRNGRPYDDDNDGRLDEDPPEDLNGDGLITVMRVPTPGGAFLVHPHDARLMKRAERSKGEAGGYTLYLEGRDTDGDGFVNEDGAGGVDLDRNFQHAYPYWERDAGPHMVSEPESRALMDFMIAHRNVAAILTYGHSDNLVVPPDNRGNLAEARTLDLPAFALATFDSIWTTGVFGAEEPGGFGGFGFGGDDGLRLRGAQPGNDNNPASGRRPDTTVAAPDRIYFEAVSEAYRSSTGITRLGTNRRAEGAFFQYGYYQFGVPSFETPGWSVFPPAPADTAAGRQGGRAAGPLRGGAGGAPPGGTTAGPDSTVLAALDSAGVNAFVPWTAFRHPDLGAVEIGGFRPQAVVNPPADRLAALGRSHAAFAVRLAGLLPRLRIVRADVTAHGGGVFTVTVEVENAGLFPTSLRQGIVARSVQPTTIQIQVPPDAVLTGDPKTTTTDRIEGSGGRFRARWVIRGAPGATVEIRARAEKGGTATTTVTLR
jgi:hypothetical protein